MSAKEQTDTHYGATIHIDFQRICPSDKSGMVNIDCDGPQGWSFADVGSHHGIQIAEGVDETTAVKFCHELSKLVRSHFGDIAPLLSTEVGRRSKPTTPA